MIIQQADGLKNLTCEKCILCDRSGVYGQCRLRASKLGFPIVLCGEDCCSEGITRDGKSFLDIMLGKEALL